MFALNLNEAGRVLSATLPEYAPPEAVMVEALPDGDLSLYRLVEGELVKDDALAAERTAQEAARELAESIAALTARLRATDSTVLEALEAIFTATSPAELITALASAAEGLKDTLTSRAALRAEIAALTAGKEEGQ